MDMQRPIYVVSSNGHLDLTIPRFEFEPLNDEAEEQRFIVLHSGKEGLGPNDPLNYVRCEMHTIPLFDALPYTAINNARGYRLLQGAIEVNGKAMVVSSALEMFLRHYRLLFNEPTRIWTRYLCVEELSAEQKKYWTRDWCDLMYNVATEVVDMHEFNTKCIEGGEMQQSINPMHQNLRKQWFEKPKEVIRPKVYPIRLGKTVVNALPEAPQQPVDEYEYVPLDMVANEIRVVALLPSQERQAPLVFHAGHCPVACEVTFVALSYQWGTNLETVEVIQNGMRARIRKGLAEVLRDIRLDSLTMPIWIDAVCINQEDTAERSRQVARMGAIFDNSCQVLCYAGPKGEDSDMALALLKLMLRPMMRINTDGEWHFGEEGYDVERKEITYGENAVTREGLPSMVLAVYRFLLRPYWRRAWILQEIAFASNPIVVIGEGNSIALDHLDQAIFNFESMLRSDINLRAAVAELNGHEEDPYAIDLTRLQFVRKLFYFRHILSDGGWRNSPLKFAVIDDASPGFLETHILTRDFEATDPRDKIYALWNLARDKGKFLFEPDYTTPTEVLYMEFAKAWALYSKSLDIIGVAESYYHLKDLSRGMRRPSWCPDWSTPSQASCLTRLERIPSQSMHMVDTLDGAVYSADGIMFNDAFEVPLFEFKGDMLCCAGIILDSIKLFIPDMEEPTEPIRCYGDPRTQYVFEHWTTQIQRAYEGHSGTAIYDDPLRAAWSMLHGDVPPAWTRKEGRKDGDDELYVANVRSIRNSETESHCARHIQSWGGSYSRASAWDAVGMTIRGRRPFITENGYMGLAPAYIDTSADKAWHIAVVATCSVPLLLRERDDGSYQLVGSCFVQGFMEGEWIVDMIGAEDARQFWQTMLGSEKLRISSPEVGFFSQE